MEILPVRGAGDRENLQLSIFISSWKEALLCGWICKRSALGKMIKD
jgi:hypothetical protein